MTDKVERPIDDTIYLFLLTYCDYIISSLTQKKWSLITGHFHLFQVTILENALFYAATKDESHTPPSANSSPFVPFMPRAKKKTAVMFLFHMQWN